MGASALKPTSLLIVAWLIALSSGRVYASEFPGCSSVLPETVVKLELTSVKTEEVGNTASRVGIFRVSNEGAGSIILGGMRHGDVFAIEEPESWEMIKSGDGWQTTNGNPGDFTAPPDKLVVPGFGTGSFETPIEPMLPTWDPATVFYVRIHTMSNSCMVSLGFTLQPRSIIERTALDAAGKTDAEICPSKSFDQDVVISFVKKQKFDFGPYADSGPEYLGLFEVQNHRQVPITLHGERHGNYFYIPESRALVQQHLASGKWEVGNTMIPATIRYPMDTLTIPAGGKATVVGEANPGPIYAGWDRTDRVILADQEAKVCTASQEIYEAPDPNCHCSGGSK